MGGSIQYSYNWISTIFEKKVYFDIKKESNAGDDLWFFLYIYDELSLKQDIF